MGLIKDYSLNLNEQIKTIAKGPFGKIYKNNTNQLLDSKYFDVEYAFIDENIKVIYTEKGYYSKFGNSTYKEDFIIFYNNKLVYPKSYNIIPKWVDYFNVLYRYTIKAIKNKEQEDEKAKILNEIETLMNNKIQTLFGLTYPNTYEDDKITISHYPYSTYEENIGYGAYEPKFVFNGRITLATGEVVYDSKEKIYHSGKWEKYVINLSDKYAMQEKIRKDNKLKEKQYKLQMQKQQDIKIKTLKRNPMDASKLFR